MARAAGGLGDLVGRACTINEPNVVALMGYLMGEFPPGLKGELDRMQAVNAALIRAHRLAVDPLRAGPGSFPVGLTLSMAELHAEPGGEAARDEARELLEDVYLRAVEGDDYIGVQGYTRLHFGPGGLAPNDPAVPTTQMGYEYWPGVIEHIARRAAAVTGLPVVVTESGIATDDDTERIAYLTDVLRGVRRCLDDGVDVRGFFVWSLLDNFEWAYGYRPKFGLCAVDPATFARVPKPSAAWFGGVAKGNALPS